MTTLGGGEFEVTGNIARRFFFFFFFILDSSGFSSTGFRLALSLQLAQDTWKNKGDIEFPEQVAVNAGACEGGGRGCVGTGLLKGSPGPRARRDEVSGET